MITKYADLKTKTNTFFGGLNIKNGIEVIDIEHLKDVNKKIAILQSKINEALEEHVIFDWDEYFMCIACLAALRSKDPRTPVSICTCNEVLIDTGWSMYSKQR